MIDLNTAQNLFIGLLVPFLGTCLGSVCVFFMKDKISPMVQRLLSGFAAGVMVAATIWSLMIPAIESAEGMGALACVPAACGFMFGILFLLMLDHIIPHLHVGSEKPEGLKARLKKSTMLVLAVTLHNIPEGMAVGVVYAGMIDASTPVTFLSALALSIGIGLQNFPEGAIISMPLHSDGMPRWKAFLYGCLSGIVEPIASILTILALNLVLPLMPWLLSFAGGAMMYVVIEELLPAMSEGEHSDWGAVVFSIGFVIMMILDITLG